MKITLRAHLKKLELQGKRDTYFNSKTFEDGNQVEDLEKYFQDKGVFEEFIQRLVSQLSQDCPEERQEFEHIVKTALDGYNAPHLTIQKRQ